MNVRRYAAAIAVAAFCAGVGYHVGSAAQPEKKDAPSAADTKNEPIDVRFARAHLRLAQLTLQKAQDMNKRTRGTLSNDLIQLFADEVDVARVELETALKSDGLDQYASWIRRSELLVRVAETKLKRASEANRISPGTISALDIERFRLGLEVAQLRLERGRALADASLDKKLAWEVDLLSDSLSRLQTRSSLIVQNRLDF